MKADHRDIQAWIRRRYKSVFSVQAEIAAKNFLPNKEHRLYQPDVILRRADGMIAHIIEVEGKPTRKSITGACILADYVLGECQGGVLAHLWFVVYDDGATRFIHNYQERARIATEYTRHLQEIRVVSWDGFRRMRL